MKDVFVKVKWRASEKLEAALKLEAEITAYSGAINLLGLYKVYALHLNSIVLMSGTDFLRRKLDTLAEQRARRRFETLTTTLANLQTQTHTVATNVEQVRDQVEEGTRVVREDIEKSSKETSQTLQRLQWNWATVSEFLKAAGTLSEVTLQT
jgi:predicted transcriptional regulator